MEELLYKAVVDTPAGEKSIEVMQGDLTELSFPVDVVVCSSFVNDYVPLRGTLIGALYKKQIHVGALAKTPDIDMKNVGVWLSQATQSSVISRVACVEMQGNAFSSPRGVGLDWQEDNEGQAFSFVYSGLFMMLRLASLRRIPVGTVAMPLLGTGHQALGEENSMKSMLAECRNALRDNPDIHRVVIVERSPEKARLIAAQIKEDYADTTDKCVFISYSHADEAYARVLANALKAKGIKVWIDYEQIKAKDFGGIIVDAIEKSDLFTVMISKNSISSRHVLTEIRNAFESVDILPIRLDNTPYTSDHKYYLTGVHIESASEPPVEENLRRIAEKVENTIKKG